MIQHSVIFRLPRPVDSVARAEFIAGCERFAASAPHAEAPASVSRDLELFPDGSASAEVVLTATFADTEAFQAYLEHPLHVALVRDYLVPYCESWLSVQAAA